MKTPTNRRTFLRLIPMAAGAPMAVAAAAAQQLPAGAIQAKFASRFAGAQASSTQPPATPGTGRQGRGGPQQPLRIKKESLHCAEELIGVELTSAQEDMALPGVDRNLTSYENLRKINVPLDTDPAVWFHPAYGGRKLPKITSGFVPTVTKPPAFKTPEDLAFATALELGALIRARKITSTAITKMYLDRLKRYGPSLLCVVTLTENLALEQAAKADKEVAAGKIRGPLHGVPWGAKDLFATKGIATTWGAEPYRDQVIPYDAHVVERLREAGAVLLAKLSMGALAQGGRWFGGMTRDPWEPEETQQGSSGSSAGSAATTAAGLVGFALGTETLGSIVSPSSRCGVSGLRPTYGRVSRYGAMGLSWTMDKVGAIARGVEDCAAVLSAIYGPDGRDLTVTDVGFRWNPAAVPVSKMRIGYLKSEFEGFGANPQFAATSGDRKKMYDDALEQLRRLGANLVEMKLPEFDTGALGIILSAEAAAAFDDLTRDGGVNQLSAQGRGDWPNSFRTSRFIPAVEYLRAQRARTLLMRQMDELMNKWDVFVSPTGGASLRLTNLTGHPAVVVPCGFVKNRNGVTLPQDIMFTGGLYDEASPLRLALAYQRATDWTTKHPTLKEGPASPEKTS
jgi:Asp-tRNA(Asn)/Glu-tRNA(Gln) amidotransferase A subunit family amidase